MAEAPEAGPYGMLHVLTGPGRGKTTSALGLALRAWGRGARVLVIQFVKSRADTGECLAARELGPRFTLLAMGAGFVPDPPREEDRRAAGRAVDRAEEELAGGGWDMIVLDELCVALDKGLVGRDRVERLLDGARGRVELVVTGRGAPEWLVERADYATELVERAHPLSRGSAARPGIEH